MDGTLALARRLAVLSSPTAVAVIKKQVHTQPLMTLAAAQAVNDRIQHASLAKENPDHKEGFDAFTQKRDPAFRPLDMELPFAKLAAKLLTPDSKL